MSNPYQPPESEPASPLVDQVLTEVRFAGGWPAILAIGAVNGAAAMAYFLIADGGTGQNPFLVIALFWLGAICLVLFLLRGVSLGLARQFSLLLLAFPVAYVLYIPVCTIGAITLAGGTYVVDGLPMVVSSVVSFAAVLLLTCRLIRSTVQRRQARWKRQADNFGEPE
jgi:hypothetical protein